MLKQWARLLEVRRNALPDSATQTNIGNLTLYHLDKALTRLEVFFSTGRSEQGLAEYEVLVAYLTGRKENPEQSADFLSALNTSTEMTAAIQYIDKLYRLLDDLLEAGKPEEALALNEYVKKIGLRLDKLSKRFPEILKVLRRQARDARSSYLLGKGHNFPVKRNRRH